MFIAEQAGHLDGVARIVAHQGADDRAATEPFADRIRRDKTMAEVYAALGARGVAADIGEAEVAMLSASGLDPGDIEDIKDRVRLLRDWLPRLSPNGAIGAEGPKGLLGPPNMAFREALGEIDADATNANVDAARRLWLQAMSVVMRDGRRYAPLDPGLAETVYREMFGDTGQAGSEQPTPASVPTAPRPAAASAAPAPAAAPIPTTTKPELPADFNFTISGLMAKMAETKTGKEWKITKRGDQDVSDSAESYIFLGRILVNLIGVDDVRRLDGQTPMQLRETLQSLPKYYGKAPADWDLSFEQATARAIEAGKPIGRSAVTINKYLNFFQAFLNYLEAKKILVPDLTKQIKHTKVRAPKKKGYEKRSSFTDEEYTKLFSDEEWCGGLSL